MPLTHIVAGSTAVGVAGSVAAFAALRTHVCKPNQYLVKSGWLVPSMSVSRMTIQLPFQKVTYVDMSPKTYSFDLHNMSKEKVEFKLPVVFTIAPKDPRNDMDGFKLYAQYINGMDVDEIKQTIQGVIEGEMRGRTAGLTIEEMFNTKDEFRTNVVSKIQCDLNKMGLDIVNANIKEMGDYDSKNTYFDYRKQRAVQTANYNAVVDVAEAKKQGEIGSKERERDTRINIAQMEADARVAENERKESIATSTAKLAQVEAEARRLREVANVETDNAVQVRNQVLQKDVELKRTEKELQTQRANNLIPAQVEAERKVMEAEAQAKAIKLVADANLYKQQQEAVGIRSQLEAHGQGLNALLQATNNNSDLAKFYMGLEKRLFQDIATEQARAFRDLKPQISIWTMPKSVSDSNPFQAITNGFQSMAPLIDGLQKHTGLDLPFWTRGNGSNAGVENGAAPIIVNK